MDAKPIPNNDYLTSMAAFVPPDVVDRVQERIQAFGEKIRKELEGHKKAILSRQRNAQESRLLRLPQELQDRIIAASFDSHSSDSFNLGQDELPGFLHTCHHLRESTAPLFYSRFRFEIQTREPSHWYHDEDEEFDDTEILENRQWHINEEFIEQVPEHHKKYITTAALTRSGCAYYPYREAMVEAAELDKKTGPRKGSWFVGWWSMRTDCEFYYVNVDGEILDRSGVRGNYCGLDSLRTDIDPEHDSHGPPREAMHRVGCTATTEKGGEHGNE